MKAFVLAAWLAAFCGAAGAQSPGCPPVGAPMPTRPPGDPPALVPSFTPPANFDEAVKNPRPPAPITRSQQTPEALRIHDAQVARQRANDDLIDGEDGHVGMIVRRAAHAVSQPPPGVRMTDAARLPLEGWKFAGYARKGAGAGATRFWRRDDGGVLAVAEWDYAAEGGSVFSMPDMQNTKVGRHPATRSGVRGASGCILSILSWLDGRRQVIIEIAGPMSLSRQREILANLGEAMAASREPR